MYSFRDRCSRGAKLVDTSLFSSHSLRKDPNGDAKDEDFIRSQHSSCWLFKISSTDLALCGEIALRERERQPRTAWLLIGTKGTVARRRVVGRVQGVGCRRKMGSYHEGLAGG